MTSKHFIYTCSFFINAQGSTLKVPLLIWNMHLYVMPTQLFHCEKFNSYEWISSYIRPLFKSPHESRPQTPLKPWRPLEGRQTSSGPKPDLGSDGHSGQWLSVLLQNSEAAFWTLASTPNCPRACDRKCCQWNSDKAVFHITQKSLVTESLVWTVSWRRRRRRERQFKNPAYGSKPC